MSNSIFRKKDIAKIVEQAKDQPEEGHGHSLNRTLTAFDLTAFGIAAIIGAGIFSTIGTAAASGGPAVSMLFIFTAIACGFSGLCYAQFASMIPVSGSAYTYAYATFGEIFAWMIGWDLLLEYAIGNIAVAISWSDYFTLFLSKLGLKVPEYLTMDFLSASRGHEKYLQAIKDGVTPDKMDAALTGFYNAWENAPRIAGIPLIADIPALGIVLLITMLVYIGIKESKNISNMLVGLKLVIIIGIILVGAFYVSPENWTPFAPNGISGVLKGASAVFFAYIGFDAISTTAEECKNPQKDLPRGIFYSLIICTVLYVLISFVLTGMVKYTELAVGDPLAFVFEKVNLGGISFVISFSAIIAMASVLLVFQMGQPRIWMSMSRDGLLPKVFSKIHPKYQTPSFATIITGFLVAIPALFMNLSEVTDLTSIGTLFAFVLVCGGVLVLEHNKEDFEGKFRVPYVNGKFIVPVLTIGSFIAVANFYPEDVANLFNLSTTETQTTLWSVLKEKIPTYIFIVIALVLSVFSFLKNFSLIPVLGLLSCLYIMTTLGGTNWERFFIWLFLGLIIYFFYSYKNSKLGKTTEA